MTYIKDLKPGQTFTIGDNGTNYLVEAVYSGYGDTAVTYRLVQDSTPLGRYLMHKPSLTTVKVID